MYVARICVYLCVYLRQVVSLLPRIRTASDLFRHAGTCMEIQFEPVQVTFSDVVPPRHAEPLCLRPLQRAETGLFRGRICPDRNLLQSESCLECGNLAHSTVCMTASYLQSYSMFNVCGSNMFIFMCVRYRCLPESLCAVQLLFVWSIVVNKVPFHAGIHLKQIKAVFLPASHSDDQSISILNHLRAQINYHREKPVPPWGSNNYPCVWRRVVICALVQ